MGVKTPIGSSLCCCNYFYVNYFYHRLNWICHIFTVKLFIMSQSQSRRLSASVEISTVILSILYSESINSLPSYLLWFCSRCDSLISSEIRSHPKIYNWLIGDYLSNITYSLSYKEHERGSMSCLIATTFDATFSFESEVCLEHDSSETHLPL